MTTELAVNGQRLWADINETARIGATERGGLRRLALTEGDREVRDWFRRRAANLGCQVTIDEVGNMFAIRAGRRQDIPPISIGSHLDTQPTGGKFDGILGVLAGLECLRTLNEADILTNAPLMVVNWTNEEGARFAPAMLGSGVYAGVFDREYADSRLDAAGVSFSSALDSIGYRGSTRAGSVPIGAMFELHIEQGPILETEGDSIGLVRGVQAIRWYDVKVTGRESHAGSTPMRLRRDALVAASRVITEADRIARQHPDAVATVGIIDAQPKSRNTIPGQAALSIDLRHPRDADLKSLDGKLRDACRRIAEESGASIDISEIWDSPAVAFSDDCVAAIREAVLLSGHRFREMVSGAGHDSVYVARVAPTAMIFVPCAGGLSHNEAEIATVEDCRAGAQVLLLSVLAYDKRFASA
jgi:N-carbamoyl-L-amino-acid hydrolase